MNLFKQRVDGSLHCRENFVLKFKKCSFSKRSTVEILYKPVCGRLLMHIAARCS